MITHTHMIVYNGVMKELVIIGAGPAGISAALYAKRANIDTKIIYLDKSSLSMAHLIENYYGIPSITGKDLYETGLAQAKKLDIPLIEDEVVAIEMSERFKVIGTASSYEADALILALGAYRNTPPIKGIKDYEGKGVSYCAVCDGFFYRNKRVAILGDGPYAAHEAEYLSNLTDNLYILTNGKDDYDETLKNYTVYTMKIKSLGDEDKLSRVIFEDDSELEIDGMFIALGSAGSADLARKVGILIDEQNKIITDTNMRTNIAGIYAAGDDTRGMLQVAKAVYEGAQAATDVINYLRDKS